MDIEVLTAVVVAMGVGGVVSIGCGVFAWYNRIHTGIGPMTWLLVAAGGWAFATAAMPIADSAAAATALYTATRFTTASIAALWVLFTVTYTGRTELLTGPRIGALFGLTHVYAVLLVVVPARELLSPTARAVTENGLTLFVVEPGPLYPLQVAASVGLFAVGCGLLVADMVRARNAYREQTAALLLGGAVPVALFVLFVVGVTPHPGLNPAPLGVGLSALCVSAVLYRYDFLRVMPLAENLLVEELPDPVLVVADDGTVVDANAAATETFDTAAVSDRSLAELAPGLASDIERGGVFTLDGGATYYEPQVSPITDDRGGRHGRLVLLRNVTGQQRRQDRLEALQTATQQFIEAKRAGRVAELTVDYVTDILDQNAAGVFFSEDDELYSAALSGLDRESVDERVLGAGPDGGAVEPLRRTYEDQSSRVATLSDGTGPLQTALLLPLGEHGVLAIGSRTDRYQPTDRQYASILARTTQVALDQVERERELRVSRERSQRRREQIDFFNGVLRHSLRNAMLVIQGRADHLDTWVPDEERQHLDRIVEWCERLTELSETIRRINETVAASEDGTLVAVDLATLLERAVRRVRSEHPEAVFEADLDRRIDVRATGLAGKVLVTVLRNAVEHNDTEPPHVEVTLERASDWVQVRIADDGPGVSEELKAAMYERAITPSQTAGGFGLSFVSVMMELYGGTVWFEDNEPRGAVAVLEFRVADDDTGTETGGTDSGAAKAQTKSHDG